MFLHCNEFYLFLDHNDNNACPTVICQIEDHALTPDIELCKAFCSQYHN